ncbi:MAG: hypothetical protein FIB02_11680 [Desulfuromonas sp.]|nr:hypothetical protein [Desulfuromonas sp.]
MTTDAGLTIKPSDLYYRYARKKATRAVPKFAGKPDPHPFDRDDLYEVIPLLEAVMAALGSTDGRVLYRAEEVMVNEMPGFIRTREEVYDCLVAVMSELLER